MAIITKNLPYGEENILTLWIEDELELMGIDCSRHGGEDTSYIFLSYKGVLLGCMFGNLDMFVAYKCVCQEEHSDVYSNCLNLFKVSDYDIANPDNRDPRLGQALAEMLKIEHDCKGCKHVRPNVKKY